MDFVENIKERICESNKKVSFQPKSSVETKSSNKELRFDSLGQSFFIYKDEVIESALFKRVTRDCRGDIIREESVRRFRKIGSDEWFSVLSSIADVIWNKDFTDASNEEAIVQGENNLKVMNSDLEKQKSSVSVSKPNSFHTVNPVRDAELKRIADKKRNKLILVLGALAVGFGAYAYYKKNKK